MYLCKANETLNRNINKSKNMSNTEKLNRYKKINLELFETL